MRISDLSSDVCSSDLKIKRGLRTVALFFAICILWSVWTSESLAQWSSIWNFFWQGIPSKGSAVPTLFLAVAAMIFVAAIFFGRESAVEKRLYLCALFLGKDASAARSTVDPIILLGVRSEEHTSELQSLMRNSY